MESKKRSLYKSITWPAVHILFVGTLVYFFEKAITGMIPPLGITFYYIIMRLIVSTYYVFLFYDN